ncbi:Hint domain-containing protein [Aliishimia ponticola]|uniref:Hint domain-containing protein n=2 Tax=Aliishimia ponticola TaxID=2499833 RepID=A0A4S4NH19_9RHOB|nr:Hint domain-containing protein [Aliishimia ponticola]
MEDVGFVCFTAGTLIKTAYGNTPVEHLQTDDLVATKDNGLQPIRWIGCKHLTVEQLNGCKDLRPVRIRTGALGPESPAQDLCVSPQHRILIRSKIAHRMFAETEVLVAAKHLCGIEGIDICPPKNSVAYYHVLFDQHEILFANNAETESLYLGPEALNCVGFCARTEIQKLFPEVRELDFAPKPCRALVSGREARQMVSRHKKNARTLVDILPLQNPCGHALAEAIAQRSEPGSRRAGARHEKV